MNICKFTIFLDTCFIRKDKKYCYDDPPVVITNQTLSLAIATCSSNPECEKVYDYGCNGQGPFILCKWGSDEHQSKHLTSFVTKFDINTLLNKSLQSVDIFSSCIYVKTITQGIKNNWYIYLFGIIIWLNSHWYMNTIFLIYN